MRDTWFLCTAILALSAVLSAQEQKPEEKAQKAGTELRVRVTGGQQAVPIKGATVYLEWQEDGETRSREGTTNADGVAGPYGLPRTVIFVQITTGDELWESYGKDHELKERRETLTINLKKKSRSVAQARHAESPSACLAHRNRRGLALYHANFTPKRTTRGGSTEIGHW